MNDMTKVHAEYWKTINDLYQEKTRFLERIKLLENARIVAAANSLTNMLAYEDAIAKIKKLEEELMDTKNKHAVLVADVVLNEDRAERIKRLEEAGDAMDKTADPFVLYAIEENSDEGPIPMSEVSEQYEITYDNPPTAGDHVAIERARKEWRKAKEDKP